MSQLYFYVQDAQLLDGWSSAAENQGKILFSLHPDNIQSLDKNQSLLMIQYQDEDKDFIDQLLQKGYSVLFCSNHPSQEEGITWFQKGIKGYLNAYAQPELIKQAVLTINSNNIWLGQNVMQAMIVALQSNEPQIDLSWQNGLTEREVQVANAILNGDSNAQIAEALFITERTVKSHVHNLLEKFAVKDRLALVLKIQKQQSQMG